MSTAQTQFQRLPPLDAVRVAALQSPPTETVVGNRSLDTVLRRRGDLTLRDTDLQAALFTISEIWKINLVLGPDVQGQVTGVFRDAPLNEILDSILACNGYGYRQVGQSLVVQHLEELGDLNPMFRSETIVLEYADPAEVAQAVGLFSSPKGRVEAIPSARSLLVLDFPEYVAKVRQFAASLDRESRPRTLAPGEGDPGVLQVAQFSPQYVSADSLQTAVQTIVSEQGKVAVTTPDNRLVVADYQPQLELVRQLVSQLDVPRMQVRITALIYDLDVRDIERLGINWNQAFKDRYDGQGDPQTTMNIDSLLTVPVNSNVENGAISFMNLSKNFDITAVVHALQQSKDSRLLADPSVTVLDHEEALMSIVTEIPYQQLTQTQQGGNIGTTDFREAGIKLQVVPHVASDMTVRMEVTPSFSRLNGYTPGEQPQPIIDRREAQTTVRVADGQVLVIGGLRQRTDMGDFNGLPYLKDIRALHLGALFRGRETEVRESELVVFIKPEIVLAGCSETCRERVALDSSECLLHQVPWASGGKPPYRYQPCLPPIPLGGPRVYGTPYQPNTCPTTSVEFAPAVNGALPNESGPVPTPYGRPDAANSPAITIPQQTLRRLPPTADSEVLGPAEQNAKPEMQDSPDPQDMPHTAPGKRSFADRFKSAVRVIPNLVRPPHQETASPHPSSAY